MAAGLALAAKAAGLAIQNKDKIGKIVLCIVLSLILPFLLLIICFLSLIQAFIPDGAVKAANTFQKENSQIYQSIGVINNDFYDYIRERMEKEKEKIIEENTVQEITQDDSGNSITASKCNVTITRNLQFTGSGYLIAYLMYTGGMDTKTAIIDEVKAMAFLKDISSIQVKKTGDTEYEITNEFLNDEGIVKRYFPEDKMQQQKYKASSLAYAEFFQSDEAEVKVDTVNKYEILDANINLMQMPLYLQYSGPWAGNAYGNGTISRTGCGPTCLAMVLSYLKKEVILPNHIVDWTGNRYYANGTGSSWSIFPAVADNWELECTDLGKDEQEIIQALGDGKPVISSMGPGTFTRGGHFIVLSGITENGKIKVNDPNDSNSKNHIDMEFEVSLIMRESKHFWSFEVKP